MYFHDGILAANVFARYRSNWTGEKIGRFCSFGVTFEFAKPSLITQGRSGSELVRKVVYPESVEAHAEFVHNSRRDYPNVEKTACCAGW